MCKTLLLVFFLKPRLTLFTAKMVHADIGKYGSFSSLSVTVNCCRPAAPENGVTSGQRLPCCVSMAGYLFWPPEKKPLLREMQTHNTTHTHKWLLHTHMIQLNTHTHNTTKTKHTHTYTVVTVAQSDPLCTMVPFEWGQTMELFGIWIKPDDEYPRRLNRRFQPPTQLLFWPWKYASVCCLLPWLKISVISMKAATL